MKKLFIGSLLAFASLSMSACSTNATKAPTSYSDYVTSAKALHAKAVAQNNVWKQKKMKKPYVEHYLAKAEEAKKAGDEAKALKLAKDAHASAEAQIRQIEGWNGLKAAWEK